MDYQVITGKDKFKFEALVQEYLNGGYALAGGVAVCVISGVTCFAQAVTIRKQ
jgi:hypothetical protein